MMKCKNTVKENVSASESKTYKDSKTSKKKKIKSVQDDMSHNYDDAGVSKISRDSNITVKKKKHKAVIEVIHDSSETKPKTEVVLESCSNENKERLKFEKPESESTDSISCSKEGKQKKRKLVCSESANSMPEEKIPKVEAKVFSKRKLNRIQKKINKRKTKKKKEGEKKEQAQRNKTQMPLDNTEKNEENPGSAQCLSLAYLRQWKENVNKWSFRKVRQVWLLKNMYKEEMVSKEDFEILLEYLAGLQGGARKSTIEQAEKMMKDADDLNSTENDDAETKIPLSEEELNRVRDVLQLLY